MERHSAYEQLLIVTITRPERRVFCCLSAGSPHRCVQVADLPLIADRSCGECTACCKYLTIDDAALRKPANVLCRHCVDGDGCTIYETRPGLCRTWFCGWRFLPWVPETWRPDRSGVLVRVNFDGPEFTFLIIGDKTVVFEEDFLKVVGGLLGAGYVASLSIPGPVGHFPAHIPLNQPLGEAVANRDLPLARSVTRRMMASLLSHEWESDGVPVDV